MKTNPLTPEGIVTQPVSFTPKVLPIVKETKVVFFC
jgi:hypothetical protein